MDWIDWLDSLDVFDLDGIWIGIEWLALIEVIGLPGLDSIGCLGRLGLDWRGLIDLLLFNLVNLKKQLKHLN